MRSAERPAKPNASDVISIVSSAGSRRRRVRFVPGARFVRRIAFGELAIACRLLFALIGILLTCAIVAAPVSYASDQVTVAVTNSVDLTVSAGDSISDGGDCTITNESSTDTVTITSITYTLSDPGLFSSTTLTINGDSETTSSPASSNSASFDVSIAPGATVDCTLSADISSSPSNSSANALRNRRLYAARAQPGSLRRGLAGVGILAVALFAGGRRRRLLLVAVLGTLAATEIACGNGSSFSSTQVITSVSASSSAGTTVSGLPATLGTMTLNGTNSSL